jgi:hypothetical protein
MISIKTVPVSPNLWMTLSEGLLIGKLIIQADLIHRLPRELITPTWKVEVATEEEW